MRRGRYGHDIESRGEIDVGKLGVGKQKTKKQNKKTKKTNKQTNKQHMPHFRYATALCSVAYWRTILPACAD
jgi:hypothetical protein